MPARNPSQRAGNNSASMIVARHFDRLFCYTANSAPQQELVVGGIMDKEVGVLVSCEERTSSEPRRVSSLSFGS